MGPSMQKKCKWKDSTDSSCLPYWNEVGHVDHGSSSYFTFEPGSSQGLTGFGMRNDDSCSLRAHATATDGGGTGDHRV